MGYAQKMGGGGSDWCMINRVRCTRILDPVMSSPQGVRQGGGERRHNLPYKRPY
jgi:hypothetical protein